MFSEKDLLPLSALQHFVFCRRQCALIHIEGLWAENRLTAEGRLLHQKVDAGGPECRDGMRIERGILLVSRRMGIIGKSDMVEFHSSSDASGTTVPFPVEFKRGRPKPDHSDMVQLTAQALCLEEMLGVTVPAGAIFYGQPRRRMYVEFTSELRGETQALAQALHEFVSDGKTPHARYERKCRSCSICELCMPEVAGSGRSALRYLDEILYSEEGDSPWQEDV